MTDHRRIPPSLEESHETILVFAHPGYYDVGGVGRVCGPNDVAV